MSERAGGYEWVQVCVHAGTSGCGQACRWAGTNECRRASVHASTNGCRRTCIQACKSGCEGEGVNVRQIKNKNKFNNGNLPQPIAPPLACGRVRVAGGGRAIGCERGWHEKVLWDVRSYCFRSLYHPDKYNVSISP